MVVLYLLMLSVAEDEKSLKLLIKVYVFSMFIYMLHSLWEFNNGRYVWRMGIVRMVGVGETMSDPNAFGASVVLSLPFAYTLFRTELLPLLRTCYYLYFAIGIVCIVLTGSRSAFIAFISLLLLWVLSLQGMRRIKMLLMAIVSMGVLWISMPAEKQERIRTLWDEEAGPANAHTSADGRRLGFDAGIAMFKAYPLTGIGPGGKSFVEYRVTYLDGIPEQPHNLYAQVLSSFGVSGAIVFFGLIFTIIRGCLVIRSQNNLTIYSQLLSRSILISIVLLLVLGLAGHNFYRPLWLWLASWIGIMLNIYNNKNILSI
jgi:O-antigen ligase